MEKVVSVKLGGSLISQSEDNLFDFDYLSKLRDVLLEPSLLETKFFIVVGGGYLARKYRDLAKSKGFQVPLDLHWIGTSVNVMHAYLIKAALSEISDDEVMKFEDYYVDSKISINKKVKIGGGGRPGHSGDMDSLLASQKLGSKTVVSLKNIDGVYDSDPSKNPSAKKIDRLSWDEYFDIIGNKTEHEPGGNYPIDPVTGRMAKEAGVRFVVIGGKNLESFKNFLLGREFVGSIVS